MDFEFENKVILITGAGSGIGAGVAIHMAKLRAKVVLVDLNENSLNDIAQQIDAAGLENPLKIVADVTTDAHRIIDETIKHFRGLDVLINNAGLIIFTTQKFRIILYRLGLDFG